MAQMVRKQIYIYKRQEAQIKRISEARGISEAEIVRNALDREVQSSAPVTFFPDPEAFERLMQIVEQRKSLGITGEPYQWRREDAYEERMDRFLKEE